MTKLISQETIIVGEDVEKGEPACALAGRQAGAAALQNSMEVLQELRNRATL